MQKYNKDLFFKALSVDVALYCTDSIDKEEFDHISNSIDWKAIPDRYIKYNNSLLSKINWKKHIDKHRAIRIAISSLHDNQDISKYPLQVYEYDFFDVIGILKIMPSLLDKLNISGDITVDQVILVAQEKPEFLTMYDFNFDNLNEEQLMSLVRIGNQDFIESMNIDLSKLSLEERFKIIKSSNFNHSTISIVGSFKEDFNNHYYIREIIIKTGDVFFDLLNTSSLYPSDWVVILKYHRHMYDKINMEDILNGDIYYLIEICMIVPDMLKYINKDNCKKISSRGWEKLLVKYGNKNENRLINMCDFSKIEPRSWSFFQREKPELLLYKT